MLGSYNGESDEFSEFGKFSESMAPKCCFVLGAWTVPGKRDCKVASFPGLLHLQFLIACSMQEWKEKTWGISSCDPWNDHQMLSRLLSPAKWYTKLILHSVLATKMGQAPAQSYTEHMKHTPATRHDSMSDKCEST